jgi:HUS1 checkpoint protein
MQAENPTVRLISPPMKTMSTVVERLKCLADRILLKANMNGELEVGVTSDMAFMTNYWKDLAAPTASE